ncbi:sorbitol dehydrogenase [Danaus plexippus plexippus]|uniref:Sorbitol dehydrogenase n=1 Tax=Danaus plexippus plexippus TaxID=278856 RepID=A0A212EZA3_DANPL|nr:sorbitol dehydrogenase [Danaus plexippus plexippus]
MDCVGICGSDLKLYSMGRCGSEKLSKPIVMGHEGAGVVVQVGSQVTTLVAGDRVAIEPTQPCRSCTFCRSGRYNVCEQPRYCSTDGADGNLCTYYKHVADFCHKIPDNVTMEEGAATQPLAIAVHACSRAGIQLGSTLLIMGAGPVGLLCAITARAMGVAKILMTGMSKHINTACVDGRNIQKVTKTGGVVLVVGIGEGLVSVPLSSALLREVDIRGSYRLLNSYPTSLAAVSRGVIDLKSFITHHFPMEKAKEALEYAKTGEPMKVIIHL